MKKFFNALMTVLVVLVVAMAAILLGLRVFGMKPLYVMSGSMEPAFPVGSLIFVQKIEPSRIQVGDPITYTINKAGDYSTHRVVGIETYETGVRTVMDSEGNPVLDDDGDPVYEEFQLDETCYYFHTKGDANDAADGAPVYYLNVVGVPKITIPYLGYLAHWLQTPRGTIMGISIGLVMIILTFLPDLLKSVENGEKKKLQQDNHSEALQNDEGNNQQNE